jgi:hypothetical protein
MLKKLICFTWGCKFVRDGWREEEGHLQLSDMIPLPFCSRCCKNNENYYQMNR